MRSSFLLFMFATLSGCAGSPSSGPGNRAPALTISIGEENVRVGERTFAIGDAEAMRAGFAGACAHGCDHVEIRAIPMARYDALLASYTAAVENEAGAISLRIATSEPASLAVGEAGSPSAACPAEVVMRRHGIEVYVNGEALPPDPECDTWSATICDSGAQDPMKRAQLKALESVVKHFKPRFAGETCLYVENEMPAMLLDRLIHAVRSQASTKHFALRRDRRAGELRPDDVTEAFVAQGEALSACYNTELAETSSTMEAVMRVLIGPRGSVLRVAVRDRAMTTPRFEECLIGALKKFTFPKPEHGGTVEVTYPLRFSPRPGLSDG